MNQQEYFDQQEYFLEKSLKKERRRRTVLLAIPAICFFIALLSNLLEILDIEAETQNALYSQDRAVSRLEETIQENTEALDMIAEREAVLSSYQEELAALPTPVPTPAPTPEPAFGESNFDSNVGYEQLQRYPANYIGKQVIIFGEVTSEYSSHRTENRAFSMYMNGVIRQYVNVLYSDEDGRVMDGDVVSVHGTIEEDPRQSGEIVLVADSIYFPTKDEINAWAQRQVDTIIDEAFGEQGEQLKEGLDAWQKGLDEINCR